MEEPLLKVGIVDSSVQLDLHFLAGSFRDGHGRDWSALEATITAAPGEVRIRENNGEILFAGPEIHFTPTDPEQSLFALGGVTIGIGFHWEQEKTQRFRGGLTLLARPGGELVAINHIPLEAYLESVIAAEMNPASPPEFLLAHAIVSRSWLAAQLGQKGKPPPPPKDSLLRWYDREDHDLYDVCADDHCQRYQGLVATARDQAAAAVTKTRGSFLMAAGAICDARFYKSCGGITEDYATAWEDREISYLRAVPCHADELVTAHTEEAARAFILTRPPAFCADPAPAVLTAILPDFDLVTDDYYRWTVNLSREAVEKLLREKGDLDLGTLLAIEPIARGPSGRLYRLRLVGTEKTVEVGKELEIRRLLSPTHLYSSAFVVDTERDEQKIPRKFTLTGAGWGHGVGMCQIGAAVMAHGGEGYQEILSHYFPGTKLEKLY